MQPVGSSGSMTPVRMSTEQPTGPEDSQDSQEPVPGVGERFNSMMQASLPRSAFHRPQNFQQVRRNDKDESGDESWPTQRSSQPQSPILCDHDSIILRLRSELETQRSEKTDETQRSEKTDETHSWRDLYLKEQRRRKKLRRDLKRLQTEFTKGERTVPSENEANLREEVESLKASIDSSVSIRRFKAPFPTDFQEKNAGKVLNDFNKIVKRLNEVLSTNVAAPFGIDVTKLASQLDLVMLLQRSFGQTEKATVEFSGIRERDLRAVVLSLIGAAICSWVFEPNAGGMFQGNNLIYPKLKGLLAAQGETFLSNMSPRLPIR